MAPGVLIIQRHVSAPEDHVVIRCANGQKEAEKGAHPKAPHAELVAAGFPQKGLLFKLFLEVLVVGVRNYFVQPVWLRLSVKVRGKGKKNRLSPTKVKRPCAALVKEVYPGFVPLEYHTGGFH